jgi:hypothetical protein
MVIIGPKISERELIRGLNLDYIVDNPWHALSLSLSRTCDLSIFFLPIYHIYVNYIELAHYLFDLSRFYNIFNYLTTMNLISVIDLNRLVIPISAKHGTRVNEVNDT